MPTRYQQQCYQTRTLIENWKYKKMLLSWEKSVLKDQQSLEAASVRLRPQRGPNLSLLSIKRETSFPLKHLVIQLSRLGARLSQLLINYPWTSKMSSFRQLIMDRKSRQKLKCSRFQDKGKQSDLHQCLIWPFIALEWSHLWYSTLR